MEKRIGSEREVGAAPFVLLFLMLVFSPSRGAGFEISGIVGTPAYARLEGAVVSLTGAAGMQDTTDSQGRYEFSGLTTGYYEVTPSMSGWSFEPPMRIYATLSADEVDQHFFGTRVEFTISGRVMTNFGSAVEGVVLALTGPAEMQDTTDSEGYYAFPGLATGDYEVEPYKRGWVFDPPRRNYSALATDEHGQFFVGQPASSTVRLVGGKNGYVDAENGEKATVFITPSISGEVRITIYTLRGEKVFTERHPVEMDVENSFEWDCRNDSGQLVAPGVYVIKIEGVGITETRKIAVIR